MKVMLPLDQMTVEEKLELVDLIWADICHNPEDIPMPAWHADVLREREQRLREGKAHFIDWDEAKRSLKELAREPK
jgi:hypothetical protein